jgi:hypothetical protein
LLHNAFAERGNRFGNGADALLVFGGEKKWAQERAVDAFAESKPLGPHPRI